MKIKKAPNINEVRRLASDIIYQITEYNAYANLALEKGLKDVALSQLDKNLVTELVNGTIRMLKHLDWVLNSFLQKDITSLNPHIRSILRFSLYQIFFMDKIPAYAIVNEAVELAKVKTNGNLAKLVNGVLRNILRNRDNITYPEVNTRGFLAVYYSHPEWLVNILLDTYSFLECEEILIYNNSRPNLQLRANLLKTNRDELIKGLAEEGLACTPHPYIPMGINIEQLNTSITATEAYQKGHFYIQNVGSILASIILDPRPEELIYDLCSGVGGKATHLAELMGNNGDVRCYDIYEHKLSILNNNAKRLGINIITTNQKDVLAINADRLADKVLLDVPCSGLGVLNRRSDLRWHKDREDISSLAELQYSLLVKASQLVRTEGLLLYTTCTINSAENEDIIKRFLENYADFALVAFTDKIPFFPLLDKDRRKAAGGMLTIVPGKYQTDGMFYALLIRKGNLDG